MSIENCILKLFRKHSKSTRAPRGKSPKYCVDVEWHSLGILESVWNLLEQGFMKTPLDPGKKGLGPH